MKGLVNLVVFVFLVGLFAPISGETAGFKDVKNGDRFSEEIMFLTSEKVISGFKDGSFKPNDYVTRAQAAIMIGRALKLDGTQRSTKLKDVPSSSVASGYITSAVEKGIISGYKDGSYKPGHPVTRGQMAIFLDRAFTLQQGNPNPFSDVRSGMVAYQPILNVAVEGIASGYTDGRYKPEQSVTRGQFSAFMARTLNPSFRSKPASVLEATDYGNRLIDFNNHPAWTVYGSTQATGDFGNYRVLQGGNRLKIDDAGRLRFELPKGSLGSSQGGGIIKADIAKKDTYTFEYEICFDQNFPWSKGGKLPGLSGGVGYTGGTPAWNGDGFSIRLMWRQNGKLVPYVYHKNQPNKYGDTFRATIGYLTDDKPHKIKYWVKLNTGSNPDGILKIYLDDELKFEKRDLVFRTDDSKIDTAHISAFPGGSNEDWKMTGTGYIRFNWIKWE